MIERKETSEEIAARVRETLPPYLQRTPEELEADRKAQALRVASFTRSKLTDEEKLITRGMQYEQIARANIETLKDDESFSGMAAQEFIRLSQGLEMQGRYLEASYYHPLPEESERLKAIDEAVHVDDLAVCDCAPDVAEMEVNGKQEKVEVYPHYEVKKVYSRPHGKIVSLVGCTKCGGLNATPTPPEQLAKILHAHTASHAAKRSVMNDVQLLGARQSNS